MYAGHGTLSGVKVSNEPVRGNQIVENKFTSVRMWMKEVQDEVWRTRTGNGYKAYLRVSRHYTTKPNPNRSRVVNPCPAGRKMGVLFLEVCTVRQYKAKGVSDGAIWTGQKSAEAIVVVLGNEGLNQ